MNLGETKRTHDLGLGKTMPTHAAGLKTESRSERARAEFPSNSDRAGAHNRLAQPIWKPAGALSTALPPEKSNDSRTIVD
jgi:hypothetical protein